MAIPDFFKFLIFSLLFSAFCPTTKNVAFTLFFFKTFKIFAVFALDGPSSNVRYTIFFLIVVLFAGIQVQPVVIVSIIAIIIDILFKVLILSPPYL